MKTVQCKKERKNLSDYVVLFVYALFMLFALAIIGMGLLSKSVTAAYLATVAGSLLGFILLFIAAKKSNFHLSRIPTRRQVLFLFILCALIKSLWIYAVRIEPLIDSRTYYDTAEQLATQPIITNARYIALFPHLFGYSFFMSIFVKMFGQSYALAPILNVAVSILSMLLIYYICGRLLPPGGAACASLLWIFLPSQTISNMFVLSEAFYTTLLLAAVALMVKVHPYLEKPGLLRAVLFGAAMGAILYLIQAVRPIAPILILSYLIWLFLVDCSIYQNRIRLRNTLALVLCMLPIFAIGTQLGNVAIEHRVGEKPASFPGYNIYVGFNQESMGAWNQADGDLLYSYSDREGWSAQDAQKQMYQEAIQRITSGKIHFAKLFLNKFRVLWGSDDSCISYGEKAIPNPEVFRVLCNAYYMLLWAFSVLGIWAAMKKRDKSAIFLIVIYMIGLTCAHMLVEVSSRYHYSGLIAAVMLAGYGLTSIRASKRAAIKQ